MGIDTSGRRLGKSRKAQFFAPDSRAGARIDGSLSDALAALREEVRTKVLRSAVHAGAEVLYGEMKLRAPVGTGQLKAAIYQWHDPKKSTDTRQVYAVGVNKSKAPHWFNVEYGHYRVNKVVIVNGKAVFTKERLAAPVWVPAVPYIRPAGDRMRDAVQAMKDRLATKLSEVLA